MGSCELTSITKPKRDMKAQTEIDCFEIDGSKTTIGEKRKLIVRNVWNSNCLVELEFGDHKIQILDAELQKAIQNATSNEVR